MSVGDVSYRDVLGKKSPHPPSSVIFFHVKPVALNFLLSLPCGRPFMSVTEPHALTMGLNLISVSISSNQLSYDRS